MREEIFKEIIKLVNAILKNIRRASYRGNRPELEKSDPFREEWFWLGGRAPDHGFRPERKEL